MLTVRQSMCVAIMCAVAYAGIASTGVGNAEVRFATRSVAHLEHAHDHNEHRPDLLRRPVVPARRYFAIPDFAPLLTWIDYMNTLAMYAAITEVVGYVEAVEAAEVAAQEVAAETSLPARASTRTAAGGGGCCTQEQFIALARCESGTDLNANPDSQGGYRTGLFGIEAGYDIGGMSRAAQEAWVVDIYNQHGASAWGVLCRGILGG